MHCVCTFGTFTGSEAILSQKVRGELITCVTHKGCECEGVTFAPQITQTVYNC